MQLKKEQLRKINYLLLIWPTMMFSCRNDRRVSNKDEMDSTSEVWILKDNLISKSYLREGGNGVDGFFAIKNDTILYLPRSFKKDNCQTQFPLFVKNKWRAKNNYSIYFKSDKNCFTNLFYYPNYYVWLEKIELDGDNESYHLVLYNSEILERDKERTELLYDSITGVVGYNFFIANEKYFDVTKLIYSVNDGVKITYKKNVSKRFRLPI